MTPATKESRRAAWKSLNFAGSIDWAVDLQAFTADDMNLPPDRPQSGEGCVLGSDDDANTGDLCAFSCYLGFCPESLCTCHETDELNDLPPAKTTGDVDVIAYDKSNVDMTRLCKFACKYDYCPIEICIPPSHDEEDEDYDEESSPTGSRDDLRCGPGGAVCSNGYDYKQEVRQQQASACAIFKDRRLWKSSSDICYNYCKSTGVLDEAKKDERTTSWGCTGQSYPLDKPIPWTHSMPTGDEWVPGNCFCDSWLANELANSFVEALPALAQVCYHFQPTQIVLNIVLGWLLRAHVHFQIRPRFGS
jgi:hypothetical protein